MTTKSIVIDFVILKKLGISLSDYIYLISLFKRYSLFDNYDNTNLVEKQYIKLDDTKNPHLRQSALDLLSYLSIDSFKNYEVEKIVKKSKRKVNAEVRERIDEYRTKWQGRKAGAMGGKQSCIDKLSRWMLENPTYSFEDVLKAADLYLDTEGTNVTYLQRADYFIYKQENNKEESSRLSAFIDDISTLSTSKDWTSTLN